MEAIGSVGAAGTSSVITMEATGAVGTDGTSSVIATETTATQTDVILPQRVDAYWHCCLLSTTVVDKPRTVAEVSEAGCDNVETETVYYDQGEDATMSASRDPRQRICDSDRQLMCEENVRTPKTLPVERYVLSPVHGSDGSMFDFEELEAKSPSEESGNDAFEFRGEDAHERFRIAELRIVQETVRKIEGDEDSDGDCPGGEVSDTEDENSTNARYVPGCRAEKVRVRNRVRRRQQPDRVPSKA
jgi:hypothetical protein